MIFLTLTVLLTACPPAPQSSDEVQRVQQEKILQEGTAQVGMPAIKNFRERKLVKDILELRDNEGFVTYSYVWSDFQGKAVYLGESFGYPVPYATQFTNPEKIAYYSTNIGVIALPQADPNGLFSPASAEGTWVMLKNPNGEKASPIYVEPRVICSPFRLPESVAIYPPKAAPTPAPAAAPAAPAPTQ